MRLLAPTLDDVLRKLYPRLIASRNRPAATRGQTREVLGALIELTDPRARLSRSETRAVTYTGLGELLWYLSRGNQLSFIQYYLPRYESESDDGETVYGGYGPRLFNHRGVDQIRNVTERLRGPGSTSRRAVVQLFDAEDLAGKHREIPCTTTLQFFVRSKRLHLLTTMRSNDAWIGLPHDIFCFTMLQEIVARTLGVGLGRYRHFAGSMHLYEDDIAKAEKYVSEGVQSTTAMPAMPLGTPWPAISNLLDAERRVRTGLALPSSFSAMDPYWADLVRLLQAFAATGDKAKIDAILGKMVHAGYRVYVDARKRAKQRDVVPPPQLEFPF